MPGDGRGSRGTFPMDQIAMNMEKQAIECNEAPFYVLWPAGHQTSHPATTMQLGDRGGTRRLAWGQHALLRHAQGTSRLA